MTRSLLTIKPPPGPSEDINTWWRTVQRFTLAPADIRNPQTTFAAGVVADPVTGNVTLGTKALPMGRTSNIPTLFGHIGDTGRAANTQFLYPVTVANRNSVQSVLPLTATSGSSTATISVAAHSVKFDFGTVSYNSGSITGLTPSTAYYVYASDPNFAGGAVSYLATTTPSNLIATGTYYVGDITTPIAATGNTITAATTANPTSLTTGTNHGWTTGNSVTISGMNGGFTALNGNTYTITVTGLNTFTVAVDATLFAAYSGSGGTGTRVSGGSSGGGGGGGGGSGGIWR